MNESNGSDNGDNLYDAVLLCGGVKNEAAAPRALLQKVIVTARWILPLGCQIESSCVLESNGHKVWDPAIGASCPETRRSVHRLGKAGCYGWPARRQRCGIIPRKRAATILQRGLL